MKAAIVSEQGVRPTMEDAHFLDMDFGHNGSVFAGIYDGHSGSYAASYAAATLHKVFLDKLLSGYLPQRAFIESYLSVSDELKTQESGTTAVNFLIKEGCIFAANAGDARALVIGKREFHQLTPDHRLDNVAERERIEKMGGIIRTPYIYRNGYGIMPTRTIGDEFFKPVGVIAEPSVSEYHLAGDDLVVLAACDGLFDFMTNEEVAEFARREADPKTLAEALKEEVILNRAGTDNLTIIAISLD